MITHLDASISQKEMKTVDALGLNALTQSGWVLIAMIQEQEVETVTVELPCGGGWSNNNDHYSCSHYNSGPCKAKVQSEQAVAITVTKYLVARDADATLRVLSEKLEEAKRDRDDCHGQLRVALSDETKAHAQAEEFRCKARDLNEHAKDLQEKRKTAEDSLRKLEGGLIEKDQKIQRLQKALGEKIAG